MEGFGSLTGLITNTIDNYLFIKELNDNSSDIPSFKLQPKKNNPLPKHKVSVEIHAFDQVDKVFNLSHGSKTGLFSYLNSTSSDSFKQFSQIIVLKKFVRLHVLAIHFNIQDY